MSERVSFTEAPYQHFHDAIGNCRRLIGTVARWQRTKIPTNATTSIPVVRKARTKTPKANKTRTRAIGLLIRNAPEMQPGRASIVRTIPPGKVNKRRVHSARLRSNRASTARGRSRNSRTRRARGSAKASPKAVSPEPRCLIPPWLQTRRTSELRTSAIAPREGNNRARTIQTSRAKPAVRSSHLNGDRAS